MISNDSIFLSLIQALIFLVRHSVFNGHEALYVHYSNKLPQCVAEVGFRLTAFKLNTENVVQQCGLQNVVNCAEVDLVGFLEAENLPVVSPILGHTAQLRPPELVHVFAGVFLASYILAAFFLENDDPIQVLLK